jgi:beta-glucosidase
MIELLELVAEALKIANQSDVIFAALGESAGWGKQQQNESSNSTSTEDLLQIIKNGKPVVVLFTGRPLVQENKAVPILNTWFAGE